MPEEQLQEREMMRTGTAHSTTTSAASKSMPSSKPGGVVAMTRQGSSIDGRPAAAAPQPADADSPAPPPRPAPPPETAEEDDFKVTFLAFER